VHEDEGSALTVECEDNEVAILKAIADVIGAIDHYDGSSAYAADAFIDLYTGAQVTPAAHVERT
jgi:hypothetical protein